MSKLLPVSYDRELNSIYTVFACVSLCVCACAYMDVCIWVDARVSFPSVSKPFGWRLVSIVTSPTHCTTFTGTPSGKRYNSIHSVERYGHLLQVHQRGENGKCWKSIIMLTIWIFILKIPRLIFYFKSIYIRGCMAPVICF